jgi:hypothetical protein
MEIDGVPNQRTCMTIVRSGMQVRTQEGNCRGAGDGHV